jgi:transposase
VLTDEQGAVLKPLAEGVPAICKVAAGQSAADGQRDPRHQNGAKWRPLPEEFGPYWMAAQTFICLSRLYEWKRLLVMTQGGVSSSAQPSSTASRSALTKQRQGRRMRCRSSAMQIGCG